MKAARSNGCTVRPTGATGSHDGLVIQRLEEKIVIISLADYQTQHKQWQDKMNLQTLRVRINAGKSLYDLTQLTRSQGFLLKSRTAGRYFTIGGIVANMVHGGGKNEGFIQEQVTGLLVMLASGNIVEITSEDELKYWRNSAGLLGIILAVEFDLLQDTGFEMKYDVKTYDMTSPSFFDTFVGDVLTAVNTYDHSEYFFNPYDGELLILGSGMSSTPPTNAQLKEYQRAAKNLIDQTANFDISFRGSPKVPISSACDLIPEPFCFDSQASAYIIVGAMHDVVQSDWTTSSTTVNDGFYSTSVPKFHSLDLFAPAGTFPQMIGQFLGLFQAFSQTGSSVYYPTGGLQFRFVNPSSKQGYLCPINPISDLEAKFLAENFFPLSVAYTPGAPAGYIALHYTGLSNINDEYSDIFLQQLENLWRHTPLNPSLSVGPANPLIPVKSVHLGKEWGYGVPISGPGLKHSFYPFSDADLLASAYSAEKLVSLSQFNAKRISLDPNGLFAGGAMMRWLDAADYPLSSFEPRLLNGQSCADPNVFYQDPSCLSSCCSVTSLTCLPSKLTTGMECEDSCQCQSNTCQAPPISKGAKPKPSPMKCVA